MSLHLFFYSLMEEKAILIMKSEKTNRQQSIAQICIH